MEYLTGFFLPFLGTTAGAACVFLMRGEFDPKFQKALMGLAAGVMGAASIWSLLLPSLDLSQKLGRWAFLPAAVGFLAGIFFLLFLDCLVARMCRQSIEVASVSTKKAVMLSLAVTLHNIPEGMAVGVAFAGAIGGRTEAGIAGALALALGIAIQNFPEGAIVSMPLRSQGMGRIRAFVWGTLSGFVEPVAAGVTLWMTAYIGGLLPWLLAFSAGAMNYVIVQELVPDAAGKGKIGVISYGVGFVLMMVLDVALG